MSLYYPLCHSYAYPTISVPHHYSYNYDYNSDYSTPSPTLSASPTPSHSPAARHPGILPCAPPAPLTVSPYAMLHPDPDPPLTSSNLPISIPVQTTNTTATATTMATTRTNTILSPTQHQSTSNIKQLHTTTFPAGSHRNQPHHQGNIAASHASQSQSAPQTSNFTNSTKPTTPMHNPNKSAPSLNPTRTAVHQNNSQNHRQHHLSNSNNASPYDLEYGVGVSVGVGAELSEVGLLDDALRKESNPVTSFFPRSAAAAAAAAAEAAAAPFVEYDFYFGDILGEDGVPPHALPTMARHDTVVMDEANFEEHSGITDEEMSASVSMSGTGINNKDSTKTATGGGTNSAALGVSRKLNFKKRKPSHTFTNSNMNSSNMQIPRMMHSTQPNHHAVQGTLTGGTHGCTRDDQFNFCSEPTMNTTHSQINVSNTGSIPDAQQQSQQKHTQHMQQPSPSQQQMTMQPDSSVPSRARLIKPDECLFSCDDLSLSAESDRDDSQSDNECGPDGDGDGDDEATTVILDSPVSGSCGSGCATGTRVGNIGSTNTTMSGLGNVALSHPDQYENLDGMTRMYVDALRDKIALMPRRKLREYLARHVSLEDVVPLMAVNRDELAGMLGLGVTTWKTFMHSIGVSRWPARALKSHKVKEKKIVEKIEEARKMNEFDIVAKLERDLVKVRGASGRMMKGIRGKARGASVGGGGSGAVGVGGSSSSSVVGGDGTRGHGDVIGGGVCVVEGVNGARDGFV